jgi:hypothetical protein
MATISTPSSSTLWSAAGRSSPEGPYPSVSAKTFLAVRLMLLHSSARATFSASPSMVVKPQRGQEGVDDGRIVHCLFFSLDDIDAAAKGDNVGVVPRVDLCQGCSMTRSTSTAQVPRCSCMDSEMSITKQTEEEGLGPPVQLEKNCGGRGHAIQHVRT